MFLLTMVCVSFLSLFDVNVFLLTMVAFLEYLELTEKDAVDLQRQRFVFFLNPMINVRECQTSRLALKS